MRASALLAVLIIVAGGAAPAAAAPSAAASVTLVDQTGTRFRLPDLAGRPAVVTFVATRCKDVCPMADAIFSTLANRHLAAQLVTITLDPDFDTPFVMARHAHDLGASARTWRVASGAPRDVVRVLAAFGVERTFDKNGIPDAHSSFIYVFDRHGRLADTLPLSTNSIADVRAAVARAF
jgi:cytochrome oxidase Cu insertion factor (SCO1/SenC/PrrC family)